MGSSTSKTSKAKPGWHPTPSSADPKRKVSASGWDVTPMTNAERKKAAQALDRESFYVCAKSGTERPFTGKTADGTSHNSKADGVYISAMGGVPVFDSAAKYDSGTGWPSFWAAIDKDHVLEITDRSLFFMPRTEVVCARSGAHLGHVFDDGPRPTGKRYCMNAAALKFIPRAEFADYEVNNRR